MAVLEGPLGPISLASTPMYMGRYQGANEIIVPDPIAYPTHHAVITPRSPRPIYSIIDVNSRQGTLVNGQRLTPNRPYWLNPGDTIQIGLETYIYREDPQPGTSAKVQRLQGPHPITLGTAPVNIGGIPVGNQLIVQGADAHHAVIRLPPSGPIHGVRDLGVTRQGTLVNGQRLTPNRPYWLNPGDEIGIGQAIFTYRISQPAQSPHTSASPPSKVPIGTLIIIAIIVLGAIAYSSQSQALPPQSTPQTTLTTFCSAVKSGNYKTAYNQLSSKFQKQETEQQFASQTKQSFPQQGNVQACTFSKVQANDPTTSTLTYTFAKSKPISYTASLVDENNNWKIDSLKPQKK